MEGTTDSLETVWVMGGFESNCKSLMTTNDKENLGGTATSGSGIKAF